MSGFKVRTERCDQCLFGPNKIVSDARRRQILQKCKREDKHFECHKGTLVEQSICCRGFYDANPEATNLMRIAGRLGVIRFVEETEAKV